MIKHTRITFKRLAVPISICSVFLVTYLILQRFDRSAVIAPPAPTSSSGPRASAVPSPNRDDRYLAFSPKASITVIEYSDLECPFCKISHSALSEAVSSATDVNWIFRHFPLGIHPDAVMEARASECIAATDGQPSFRRFIDAIFSKTKSTGSSFGLDGVVQVAVANGSDPVKIRACIAGNEFTDVVTRSLAAAREAGVRATPTTFFYGVDGRSAVSVGSKDAAEYRRIISTLR